MTRGYLIYEVHRPPRWSTFVVGLGINLVGVTLLAVYAPRFVSVEQRDPIATSQHVTLIAPALEHPRPVAQPPELARLESPKRVPAPALRVNPPKPPRVATPPPEKPKVETAKLTPPKPEVRTFASAAPPAVKIPPRKELKTNVFDSPKSDIATVRKPARQVQTGGFGDPQGVPGQGDPKRHTVTVASAGSFDLPSGPGMGNGSGGMHGLPGVVRSAGFGGGSASSAPVRANRTIAASGFGEGVAQPVSASRVEHVDRKPELQPVEILYKPRPVYTAEARRRRVEGEVLLDVVFEASGALHIRRVVRGLGFGLDDNALAAAQRIQFRPARRDGQPYDCAALVHIVFELSE